MGFGSKFSVAIRTGELNTDGIVLMRVGLRDSKFLLNGMHLPINGISHIFRLNNFYLI